MPIKNTKLNEDVWIVYTDGFDTNQPYICKAKVIHITPEIKHPDLGSYGDTIKVQYNSGGKTHTEDYVESSNNIHRKKSDAKKQLTFILKIKIEMMEDAIKDFKNLLKYQNYRNYGSVDFYPPKGLKKDK